MGENDISKIVVNACFHIHSTLGPGLFESVYEEVLAYELSEAGLSISRQQPISIVWKETVLDQGFRADIIVESKVLVEVKSIKKVEDVHKKQVLTYLKLSRLKLGLLVNFNEAVMKSGLTRIVNGL